MAFKTYAGLTTTTTVLDADLLATYSGSGPLKAITALNHAAYIGTKLLGASGHFAGYLDGANTWSAVQTLSINTATTVADYLVLKPTDYGTGKPGLFMSKEATALNWQIQLYDGATVAGQLDVKLTLLNITGSLAASGATTLSGGLTQTGSTKQNVTAAAALNIDVTAGDFFTKSISANSTFTFSGATALMAQVFILDLTISSAAVPTWPVTVKWSLGVAPTLGNGRHIVGFVTDDGGTTWVGVVAAVNVS